MKNRLLTVWSFLCLLTTLQAQTSDIAVTIIGDETCNCDGCFVVTVTNAQPPFFYQWSNGISGTMNNTTDLICGFCPGNYSVTITPVNSQDTASTQGTIFPSFIPINIISLDPSVCSQDSLVGSQACELLCAGATATYTIESFGSPGTPGLFLNWTVTGATSWTVEPAPANKLHVTWGTPGTGNISVFGSSPFGCVTEDAICVTVLEPPKAAIGSVPAAAASGILQVCKGQTVDFQNLSTGDADYLKWTFSDDLTTSALNNPQHTYQTPGTHTVTLVANSSCLCADTTTMTVEVLDAEAPSLDCVATVCPGETVTYTSSNACAPFNWVVSSNGTVLQGGTATSNSITITWNDGPLGTISLSATACSGATCPIAGTINIPVVSDNAEIRGEERVCPGASEVYSIEPFGGCGFVWTLSGGGTILEGQGSNRIKIEWSTFANTNTTYWLSVKYDNCYLGCGGQDSIPIKILPAYYISGSVEVCLNETEPFASKLVGNNMPINCNWELIGPSGTSIWSSAANSTVNVPFLTNVGYYRLFATPANTGQTCTNQADWAINVRALPTKLTGIKGITKICPGITYTYTAEGGTPQSNYLWTVKNGPGPITNFPGKDLNVTWNATGPHWVSLAHVSNDGLGCLSDTIMLQVAPFALPPITGTPVVCEDEKGNYSIDPLEKVSLDWHITPSTAGTVSAGQGTNAVQIFWSQAGSHQVNLNVCGMTSTFGVTVLPTPEPDVMAPANLCPGATGLVQTSTPYSSYVWKASDGTVLSTNAFLMMGPGNYAVEVTDANGCTGTKEFAIGSWEAPDVSLTTPSPTGFCNNSLFVPMVALTNADADYTFQWFQDGVLIPGATGVNYSSNQYANFTVQATNSHGCTNFAGPIRLFEYCGGGGQCTGQNCSGDLCPPGTVDLAIDATARCDSFQMHLLDPNHLYMHGTASWIVGISGGAQLGASTDTDPNFIFDNAGEYVAILTVTLTDGNACHVYDFFSSEAVARFDVLPACPGEATNFVDVSEFLPSGGISNWDWQFGDPSSGPNNVSTIRNPDHIYSPTGNYTVQLTVTGNSGCTSSATRVAEIPVLPSINFAEPALKCEGNALEFIAPPNPADLTELKWDFGDPSSGASNDALGSPAYHSFATSGNYTVTATATNIYGCTATFSRNMLVNPNNLAGTITPPVPGPICEGKSLTLGAPSGGNAYVWSDDLSTATSFLTVSQEGSYQVTVTDVNGCTYVPPAVNVEVNAAPDALIKALIFNDLSQIIGVSYPSYTICEGEDVVLQAVANTTVNFSWSVSNGNNQLLQYTDDRDNLLTAGTYNYSVTVTNPATGCTTVTSPFTVNVNPVPAAFSIAGNGTCAGSNSILNYSGPPPTNLQLIWSNGVTGPTLQTNLEGIYQLRAINSFGCETRSDPWTILPGPPVLSLPAGCHTRCNPDTLCIPNLPTVIAWQWYQDGNPIPGATSSSFIAQQSGTYWAQLTDYFGCSAQSDPLTLDLYTGYGNILGQVWSDVNNNGIIDAADTLMSGIPVLLYQNAVLQGAANSGTAGNFAFTNILSTNYSVELDPTSLPPNWHMVIGQDPVSLSGCDVEGQADLLLHYQCQISTTAVQLQTCPGNSVTYNGVSLAAGTSQDFSYTNWLGCDSVVTVNVLQSPTSFETLILHACPGETASYGGSNIAIGAFQDFTYTNVYGCDSIVEAYVLPWPVSTGTETLYACEGSSATYAGVNIPAGTSQTFQLMNWHGCDSTVTVTVQELPTSTGSATLLFACSGGAAQYNGTMVPAGTSQQFTLHTWLGCDSIVTVSVVALPPASGALTLYACPGGAATYNGTSIPVGASQNFSLQNWLGCDSIVTVNVAPWNSSAGTANLFACPGGTATYAGVSIPEGSSQNITLQNWLGCDSIVTVNVAAWATSSNSIEVGVCPGETYQYQGATLSGGSTQAFVLQNWLGCDSTVTVTVKQLAPSSNAVAANVCAGKKYDFNGTLLAGGETMEFHLTNAVGCDSTITVSVTELPAVNFNLQTEKACSVTPNGTLQALVNPGGQGPFQYSLDNTTFQPDATFTGLSAGEYELFLEDANGCVFSQRAVIPEIPPIQVELPNGILPCDEPVVTLIPVISGGDTASLGLKWVDGSTASTLTISEAGPVWLEVTDICGTERSEAMVEWADISPDLSIVYVPNVMKPSAVIAENATFKPLFAAGIDLLEFKFMIFDRWGNQLFQTQSTEEAWDGVFDGQAMNPAVHVWYLEADVAICGRIIHVVKKGDVTIVR